MDICFLVLHEGVVRTAHEAGWVTPLATLVEGRALRENDRQHMPAAQGSGRTQGDSPQARLSAENNRQCREAAHFTLRDPTWVIPPEKSREKKVMKIGTMQVDPYSMARTPIKLENLKQALQKYPARQCARDIEQGFSEGYKLGYIGERQFRECKNLKSAYDNKSGIQEKIKK
jgi:hypothetical protein